MEQEATTLYMQLARSNKATLALRTEAGSSPSGEAVILAADDHEHGVRILWPATQIPPVAAMLLRVWRESQTLSDGAQLEDDRQALSACMADLEIKAERVRGTKFAGGRVRLSFDVAGAVLCLEIDHTSAVALANELLAGEEVDDPARAGKH